MNANMDEVHQRMVALLQALQTFNDQVAQTAQRVTEAHERVNPLWQDSMRREYDARYLPLKEGLDAYIQHIGPQYLQILQERITNLNQYLHGH